MPTKTALLIIDTQVGLIEPAYQGSAVLARIRELLTKARNTHTPVIYVQHDEPKGYELEVGAPAWEIHPSIAPQRDEVVVHKRTSDSFYGTSLHSELQAGKINHLVVVGEQTEFCIDTTVRSATTMGYEVTLVGDAHTTFDSDTLTAAQIIAHHNNVLNGFGTTTCQILVKPASEIVF
jgi:nicotinamidase-related amidase